jgi:hypothetical protein
MRHSVPWRRTHNIEDVAHLGPEYLYCECAGCVIESCEIGFRCVCWITEVGDSADARRGFLEQFEPFPSDRGFDQRKPGNVVFGTREVSD